MYILPDYLLSKWACTFAQVCGKSRVEAEVLLAYPLHSEVLALPGGLRLKKYILIASSIFVGVIAMHAKDPVLYQTGHLTQMRSVSCGFSENSAKNFVEAFVSTDGENAKSKELLCQEYVLTSEKIVFHIRPKEEKRATLLPIGEEAKFRIKKDKLMLAIPEIGAKEAEYYVVSMAQITPEKSQSTNAGIDTAQSGK